jgi:hypothetical protein
MNTGEKGRLTKAAEILSVIFHPLFIPLYGLLIIYSSPTLLSFIPFQLKRLIFILVLTNNVILPLALAAILYARGAITTFNARDRNERVILLSFALMMYTLTAYLLMRMEVPNLFRAYFISIAVVTLISLLVTTIYRISLHAVGIGGLLVLVVTMILLYDITTVWQPVAVAITGGAVMSSRIYLDDHTPAEVWTGLAAGAVVMALSLLILLRQ